MPHGPQTPFSDSLHAQKYRTPGETFRERMNGIAASLKDDDTHYRRFRDILLDMRFMPAGRIQASLGATRYVTPYNCFVSGTIKDSLAEGEGSILARFCQAMQTMRTGGGIGYDFSELRPRGEIIATLQAQTPGPVAFLDLYSSGGLLICSAGHRRGAQMGMLRVEHPDIEEFINAKHNETRLRGFNVSIAVTDEFMQAVQADASFDLRWKGKKYRTVRARDLWEGIMRSTWDWAEPGVIFIDTVNAWNNLHYCETIAATNPCGEQPLPPFGACLLGSFNLVKYLYREHSTYEFDRNQLLLDIPYVVRAMDNVVDRAMYPLFEQREEAHSKRRMGLGITGLANTVEALGFAYGSRDAARFASDVTRAIANEAYSASADLADEKKPFPKFNRELYLQGKFIQNLAKETRDKIHELGIRNSHLTSIAPTGTISLCADNVSSSIEPVFAYEVERTIEEFGGPKTYLVKDYGDSILNIKGKCTAEVTVPEHLSMLKAVIPNVDSSISKTLNVPQNTPWEEFERIYFDVWEAGGKGCTTYQVGGQRAGVVKSVEDKEKLMLSDLDNNSLIPAQMVASIDPRPDAPANPEGAIVGNRRPSTAAMPGAAGDPASDEKQQLNEPQVSPTACGTDPVTGIKECE